MQILVSVIIPVYNTKEYLYECVNSVCSQSQQGLEIILVDDGSTDGSGMLCDALAADNSSVTHTVRSLHKPNGGLADARNYGIKHANGEYLLFLDSDDYYLSLDAISKMYTAAKESDSDVLCFHYTRRLDHAPERPFDEYFSTNVAQLVQETIYTSSACLKMIRASVLHQHGIHFITGQTSEDVLFSGKLLATPHVSIAFLNEVFYFYRVREGSLTKTLALKNIVDTIGILYSLLDFAGINPNAAVPPNPSSTPSTPLLSYIAFQYATLLINIHLCADKLPKRCRNEVYRLKFLLPYNQSRTVRTIYLCSKCIGIRATSALLALAFWGKQVLHR